MVPSFDHRGLKLRTVCSSLRIHDRSNACLYSTSSSPARPALIAAAAASAASMPLFMALWLPLMRGTFSRPAESPSSTPPGKYICGIDWKPPSLIARAP